MLNLIRKLVEIKINFFPLQVHSLTGLQPLVEWAAPLFPEGLGASRPPRDLLTLLVGSKQTQNGGGCAKGRFRDQAWKWRCVWHFGPRSVGQNDSPAHLDARGLSSGIWNCARKEGPQIWGDTWGLCPT